VHDDLERLWFRFIVARTKMTEISSETGMSIERSLTRPSSMKCRIVPTEAPQPKKSGILLYPSESSSNPMKLSSERAKTLAHSARI